MERTIHDVGTFMSHLQRNCQQKKAFASKAEARAFSKEAKKRYGQRQRTYQCVCCGQWHLSCAPLKVVEDLSHRLEANGLHP